MNLAIILFLTNFIRTLLIIIFIYYGVKLLTRFVLPLLMDKTIKNMQSKMQDQVRQQQRQGRSNGDVTVEFKNKSNQNSANKGEYVDFEEVE